jgi:hypothetical protein
MAVATSDLRAVLDLQLILAGDILACKEEHSMLACLMAQKQELPPNAITALPMGVTIEIGQALDIDTLQNLMMGNKLMMEAFSSDLTRRKYAYQMLSATWFTLFRNTIDKNYSLFFEFQNINTELSVQILPGKVRFIISATSAVTLQNMFPLAESITDDGKYIIGINIVAAANASDGNQATPTTIVNAIGRLMFDMSMVPPASYARSVSWLKKVQKLMGFMNHDTAALMSPIYDKLFIYYITTT